MGGEPRITQQFVGLLGRSLFCQGSTRRLRGRLRTNDMPKLHVTLRGGGRRPTQFTGIVGVKPRLRCLYRRSAAGEVTFRCLVDSLLLDGGMMHFISGLGFVERFGCPRVPPTCRRTLCVCGLKISKRAFSGSKFGIDRGARGEFRECCDLCGGERVRELGTRFKGAC